MGRRNYNEEEFDSKTIPSIICIIAGVFIAAFVGIKAESFILGLIILVGAFYLAIKLYIRCSNTYLQTPQIHYQPEGASRKTLQETEYFCKIAGAQHHNNEEEGFVGFVCSEPSNPYDNNAIAICNMDGKIVGYIPRVEQKDFRAWTDRENLPCIGYFTEEYNGQLQGKVKVVDADRITTELHITKFALWLVRNYGKDYIPSEFYSYAPYDIKTEGQWLDYLEEVVEKKASERKEMNKRLKAKAKAEMDQ